jgi:hypothetical protein
VKRLLVVLAVLSLTVAAPADGKKKSTKLKIKTWSVTSSDSTKAKKVKNGKTFIHCESTSVLKLVAKGKMSNPSKKGVEFSVSWLRDGTLVQHQDGKTRKKGKVKLTLAGGGAPLEDGKWQVVAIKGGAPIGGGTIKVKSSSSACGGGSQSTNGY